MRGPPFPSYAGLQAAIHSERSVSATQFKRFADKQRERQQIGSSPLRCAGSVCSSTAAGLSYLCFRWSMNIKLTCGLEGEIGLNCWQQY